MFELRSLLLLTSLVTVFAIGSARADELENPNAPTNSDQGSALRDKKTSAGKKKQPGKELEQIEDNANTDEESQNKRMRALEGSKSKWSGQFNLSYNGSSINNPFQQYAPNPGNQNPPPVVNLGGSVAVRRRLGAKSSIGFGAGVETEHPLQGPANTSIADPAVDFAISSDKWGIHNRFDFFVNAYTANYETKYGYLYGLAFDDDVLYKFPKTEFTLGISLISDFNGFSDSVVNGKDYSGGQDELDYYVDPFAEYGLTSHLNLRSVVGIPFEHDRDADRWTFTPKRVYETFGLGISATDDLFFYLFLKFYPSPLARITATETTLGINAIINLF